jgi:hypothetical protein
MSSFESVIDIFKRSYPQMTFHEEIISDGKRVITYKTTDGFTQRCYIRENRNKAARDRLRGKYHQRKMKKSEEVSPEKEISC